MFLQKRHPDLDLGFWEGYFGGHINIGPVTIYGENAMHWEDLMSPDLYSRITPLMIKQTLASMEIKDGIHVFCHRDRKMLERKILSWFIKFYEVQRVV